MIDFACSFNYMSVVSFSCWCARDVWEKIGGGGSRILATAFGGERRAYLHLVLGVYEFIEELLLQLEELVVGEGWSWSFCRCGRLIGY